MSELRREEMGVASGIDERCGGNSSFGSDQAVEATRLWKRQLLGVSRLQLAKTLRIPHFPDP